MTAALFLLAFAFVPLFGLFVWRAAAVRDLDLPARISIAFACGALVLAVVMYAFTLAGIPWTRTALSIPLFLIAATGIAIARSRGGESFDSPAASRIGLAVIAAVAIYAIASTRATCYDLFFFWGPKGQAFHRAGGIDFAFLSAGHHHLMHSDYPPLLPLLFAWGSLAAYRFSWWGALLLTIVFYLATIFAFRGLARRSLGARADDSAILLAAVLAVGYASGMVAGAADPALVMFATIAVAALTFGGDDRGLQALAALALAGAAFTKVEGASFAAATLVAFVLTRRRVAAAIAMALPALLLLGSWVALMKRHDALDAYQLGRLAPRPSLIPDVLREMLRHAHYSSFHLPWLAALAPLPFGRNWRRAALPLLAAAGVIASAAYFYIHLDPPSYWVASSVERVLLTALMCLVVASAAASE